jgi:fatty acid desaturase
MALGLLGSGCTTVPWFSYYFSGGHARHHRFTGTPRDIDREAFFWAWERTPKALDSAAGSVLWASIVGLGLPILYVASLSVCLLGNWRGNIRELCFFGADTAATAIVHGAVGWYGGTKGLIYLILSMGFGNGFLAHPLIGFWIMQHLCHKSGDATSLTLQPTVSYSGSRIWNWLNFNQLSHVEHHDFSRLAWTQASTLAAIAPEFYGRGKIYSVPSILGLVWEWVTTKGDKMNFGCILAEPIPLPRAAEHEKSE